MRAIRRRSLQSRIGGLAAILVIGAVAPLGRAQTYDLATDWSITVNPNGPWAYGLTDGLLIFTPFTDTVDAAYLGDFWAPQPAWNGGYPMVLCKSTGTTWHDFPLGRVGGHTSNNTQTRMAVRWTAPNAGRIDIRGGAWMFREIGRNDLISLYVNGVALFDDVLIPARSAGYNSSATFSLGDAMVADGSIASNLLDIPVFAGDTVMLTVRKTVASPFGDYVGLDLTIDLEAPSQIVGPTAYAVLVGSESSHNLNALLLSDDVRHTVQANATTGFTSLVELTGVSPHQNVTRISFILESHTNFDQRRRFIYMYNFTADAWEQLSMSAIPLVDGTVQVNVTANPNRFIEPLSRHMKARVGADFPSASRTLARSFEFLDRAVWEIQP